MARSVKVRQPRASALRRLHSALEADCNARQRRRIEAILLHGAGVEASTIADGLGSHVNTIYADLRAFEQDGVHCVRQPLMGGGEGRAFEREKKSFCWKT